MSNNIKKQLTLLEDWDTPKQGAVCGQGAVAFMMYWTGEERFFPEKLWEEQLLMQGDKENNNQLSRTREENMIEKKNWT